MPTDSNQPHPSFLSPHSLTQYPYPSQRMPVLAPRGVVATGQSLAAQAGLSMLQRGGNAVDAAIAAAITLTVVEPTSNGIGSDAFALVWDGERLHGLNGSGRAPAGTSVAALRAAGHATMPTHGWWPVTVPGAPRAWADLHARFGRMSFSTLFAPAIYYAEHGFPVSPQTAQAWDRAADLYAARHSGPEFAGWFETFAPDGHAPAPGERWTSPGHAATLRRLADSMATDFYEGQVAAAIAAHAAQTGGALTGDDLAAHASTWVEPLHAAYRGFDVWEIPPNGQGIAALLTLQILDGLDLTNHARDSVEGYHLQIEAMKLGFADALRYVADPDHVSVPAAALLNPAYAAERRARITAAAREPVPGTPPAGGTVYLCAADSDGLMVSFIQSNYMGFGSGIVVPGTGIALQNRGANFTLEDDHPNQIAPGKRPYHTIIPGFLTRNGQAVGPFGVMGGFMQPQGHVQMMVNTLDYGMNPQASLDAPRWQWEGGKTISVESGTTVELIEALQARGHDVRVREQGAAFGRGQIIWRLPEGGYMAGSDLRADGAAVGY